LGTGTLLLTLQLATQLLLLQLELLDLAGAGFEALQPQS